MEVEEEDEARGQTHRLNTNKIVSDQAAEYTADNWECYSSEAFDITSRHRGSFTKKLLSLIFEQTGHSPLLSIIGDTFEKTGFFPLREQGVAFLTEIALYNSFS